MSIALGGTMSKYSRLSVAEKERYARKIREPAVACPVCDAQVMPCDLLAHRRTRCPGKPEPHQAAKWVAWGEAMEMGATPWALSRWVRNGAVLVRGPRRSREYLKRDLAKLLAKGVVAKVQLAGGG